MTDQSKPVTDAEIRTLSRVVAILVHHASRRARREITELLDQEDAMADAGRGDGEAQDEPEQPRYPDESQDELDRSAPIGDRQYVPQALLDRDGKRVTFRGIDPETGEVVEGTAPLVIAPEHFKEAARRRGVDVDA
jgi:hypothetical protein